MSRGELDEEAMIDFVQKNTCCSTDERIIRSNFMTSKQEGSRIEELVKNEQLHTCNEFCKEPCVNIQLPSLLTIIKEKSTRMNLRASDILKTKMMKHLNQLTMEQKTSLSTYDWLDLVWKTVEGDIDESRKLFVMTLQNGEEIVFEVD